MYHDPPRGKAAVSPALLAMATLLQGHEKQSDAGAVLDSVFDKRWQMVLGCRGEDTPPFSQGRYAISGTVLSCQLPYS